MAALRVEPPLQFVALYDEGAGDQTVAVAQCGVADVDQQSLARPRGIVGVGSLDAVEVRADPLQQLVDADGRFGGSFGAHCQSSGRSTCSRRMIWPVRL